MPYCEQCGCEILAPEDIGRKENDRRRTGMPCPKYRTVTVYTCRGCADDEKQAEQDAIAAGDYDIDIAFDALMKKETGHGAP